MGNLIKWKTIDSESTFDTARIYRATSESGSYSLLASQGIGDASYYDPNGTTTHWYKIDFYDTTNAVASSLSTAIQGGTFKAYCTPEDVRNITNISTSDATDTQLANLIGYAGTQLNSQINVLHEEEKVEYIDNEKQNTVNGTNTTFYTKDFPIGDYDGDSDVDTSDIKVYQFSPTTGARTELTVSTITPNEGKFVLSSAPTAAAGKMTVTYNKSSLSVSTPDPLVKMATACLTAAWAYTKINVGKAPRWRIGSTQIWRDMESFNTWYSKYLQLVEQINNREITGMGEHPYEI